MRLPAQPRVLERYVVVDGLSGASGLVLGRVLPAIGLGEALDPLASQGHSVDPFAVALVAGLTEDSVRVDEVALGQVSLDEPLSGFIENRDFVPLDVFDPFAPIVLVRIIRSDADANRCADILDRSNAADDFKFRDSGHDRNPYLLAPWGFRPIRCVPLGAAERAGSRTWLAPSTAALGRQRGPERSGGRWKTAILLREEFGRRLKGKIVGWSRCWRGWSG